MTKLDWDKEAGRQKLMKNGAEKVRPELPRTTKTKGPAERRKRCPHCRKLFFRRELKKHNSECARIAVGCLGENQELARRRSRSVYK